VADADPGRPDGKGSVHEGKNATEAEKSSRIDLKVMMSLYVVSF
jgi:hypothetical protein